MKQEIHPKYFKTTATCACGATYEIGSTKENIRVEICSKCHPLFTGTEKMLDSEGRVEKFKRKVEKAKEKEKTKKDTAEKKRQEIAASAKKEAEEKRSEMEKLEALRRGKPAEHKEPAAFKEVSIPSEPTAATPEVKEALPKPKIAPAKKAVKKAAKPARKAAAKKPAKKKSK